MAPPRSPAAMARACRPRTSPGGRATRAARARRPPTSCTADAPPPCQRIHIADESARGACSEESQSRPLPPCFHPPFGGYARGRDRTILRVVREEPADGPSAGRKIDRTAGCVRCPPLGLGPGGGVIDARLGTDVRLLPSASAVYAICAMRDRRHVLVRRHETRIFHRVDLLACQRLLLRAGRQRGVAPSVWTGVPGFCARHDPADARAKRA